MAEVCKKNIAKEVIGIINTPEKEISINSGFSVVKKNYGLGQIILKMASK